MTQRERDELNGGQRRFYAVNAARLRRMTDAEQTSELRQARDPQSFARLVQLKTQRDGGK